jgi:hypothetical protein
MKSNESLIFFLRLNFEGWFADAKSLHIQTMLIVKALAISKNIARNQFLMGFK